MLSRALLLCASRLGLHHLKHRDSAEVAVEVLDSSWCCGFRALAAGVTAAGVRAPGLLERAGSEVGRNVADSWASDLGLCFASGRVQSGCKCLQAAFQEVVNDIGFYSDAVCTVPIQAAPSLHIFVWLARRGGTACACKRAPKRVEARPFRSLQGMGLCCNGLGRLTCHVGNGLRYDGSAFSQCSSQKPMLPTL